MAEPTDAVMPVLRKIQEDVAANRRDTQAVRARLNDVAEHVAEIRDDTSEIRRDNLTHLGLTAKHRVDFEELREELKDLRSRVAALESRS